ncbi:hypothetical protein MNBD_GAMMA08-2382 [hydrothermal vent metagenome]|uniref:Glycosyltransferase 2-like domain-containing protein n=1 Tax=hydrothermal vent metagenome TaxID=652676 RepID=A0A3B0XVX3_9ZZZZ
MKHYLNEHTKVTDKKSHKETLSSMNEKRGSKKTRRQLLSIIVPVYNEEEVIEICNTRLNSVADTLALNTEIIYVNDGSSDNSLPMLNKMREKNKRVSILDLSRNFGKEIAMTAGLDHAQGDAVIVIDADLQDPPELIPQMIAQWQQGYDVVYMKRANRRNESLMKKITAYGFYRIINSMSYIDIPQGVGDFRLLSRRAVDSLCQLRESNRFMKGMFAWLGFKQKEIIYDRDEREKGKSKWSYPALFNLAIEGITSFSTAPLKLASVIGFICLSAFFILFMWQGVEFFVFHQIPSSTIWLGLGFLLFCGLQMSVLGIIGEYLGRMYMETKKRPLYLINEWQQSAVMEKHITPDNSVLGERHLS